MKNNVFQNIWIYLPGLIQLILVPLVLALFHLNDFSLLSRFKIFTDFKAHHTGRIVELLPKKNSDNGGCQKLGNEEARRLSALQKKLNTLQRVKEFYADALFLNQASYFTKCYVVLVKQVDYDKIDFKKTGKILQEKVVWRSTGQ